MVESDLHEGWSPTREITGQLRTWCIHTHTPIMTTARQAAGYESNFAPCQVDCQYRSRWYHPRTAHSSLTTMPGLGRERMFHGRRNTLILRASLATVHTYYTRISASQLQELNPISHPVKETAKRNHACTISTLRGTAHSTALPGDGSECATAEKHPRGQGDSSCGADIT